MGGLHLFAITRTFDKCCGESFFKKKHILKHQVVPETSTFVLFQQSTTFILLFQKSFRIFSSTSVAYLALQGQWPHLRLTCAQTKLKLEVWRMSMTELGSPSLHPSCVPASDSSPLSLVKLHISCYYHKHHHLHHFSSHY